MKFIHCTDLHIMGRNPLYRKDNYLETIKEKIKWINSYAESVDARGILCTGDIFDKPDTAYGVLNNEIISLFKNSPVIWYTIAGNHDMFGYNPETLSRTPYQTLRESNGICSIDPHGYIDTTPAPGGITRVEISGLNCNAQIDNREDKAWDYGGCLPPREGRCIRIHMAHGFLANKDWGDKIAHTQISEISDKIDVDILLCGHEHSGFGIVEQNGTIFINPGSVGRITSGVGDINRKPQIAEITIDEDGISAKLVDIAVAKDADEVIDYEKAKEIKEKKKALENFTQQLTGGNQLQIEENMSVFDCINLAKTKMIEDMGVNPNYADIIVGEAKDMIQKAMEKTGGEI